MIPEILPFSRVAPFKQRFVLRNSKECFISRHRLPGRGHCLLKKCILSWMSCNMIWAQGLPSCCSRRRSFTCQGVNCHPMSFQQTIHALGLEVCEDQFHTLSLQLTPQRPKRLGSSRIQAMHESASYKPSL